jgi:predicted transposase/invertase (TIGR01784 family)
VKSEFTAAGIQATGEKLDILKMTPQERAEYERTKRSDMDQKTQLYTAELKGLKKGMEKGMEKGRTEGKAEEKEEAVIRGHHAGCSVENISQITGLTAEQIIKILKQNELD